MAIITAESITTNADTLVDNCRWGRKFLIPMKTNTTVYHFVSIILTLCKHRVSDCQVPASSSISSDQSIIDSCTYMSTVSMYYHHVFDFSGVYVHRAQSRHCTQWYLYFVSPSSLLFQRRQSQQYFIWGEQASKRIAGRLWLENFEVLQILESVKNPSCRQAGEHKIGVVLQRRGQVGTTLDELWGDYKNELGAGDRTAVAWEHWSE